MKNNDLLITPVSLNIDPPITDLFKCIDPIFDSIFDLGARALGHPYPRTPRSPGPPGARQTRYF